MKKLIILSLLLSSFASVKSADIANTRQELAKVRQEFESGMKESLIGSLQELNAKVTESDNFSNLQLVDSSSGKMTPEARRIFLALLTTIRTLSYLELDRLRVTQEELTKVSGHAHT
jgi:hypothetical protein